MGLTPLRLLEYFTVDELKTLLSIINESQTGTRPELIERLMIEWPTHNKKWEGLLGYLDRPTLSRICEDYDIDHHGARDVLARRLGKELRKNFPQNRSVNKSTNMTEKSMQSRFHISRRIAGLLIIWSLAGMTVAVLNLVGTFVQTHDEPIDISKEYSVQFMNPIETIQNKTTISGLAYNMKLNGKITLTSTLFSAQNPIDVNIELQPNTDLNSQHVILLDTLPAPFEVYFVNAENIETERSNENQQTDNDDVAIIKLTKSADSSSLEGSGKIIYSKGGIHEIYVLDPRETKLKTKILTANLPSSAVKFFEVPEIPKLSIEQNGIVISIHSELGSESDPYSIEIKQADALDELEIKKQTGFGTWLTITSIVPGIAIGVLSLRKH